MEKNQCNLPPTGWECTREKYHDGPCAAVQVKRWNRWDYITAIMAFVLFLEMVGCMWTDNYSKATFNLIVLAMLACRFK